MRVGQNPNRSSKSESLTDIVLAVVTHLPNFAAYHEHRLEVVKACLLSMKQYAPACSIAIWDNGSCNEFRRWVVQDYRPDIFVQSVNVGKSMAKFALFGMFRQDTLIAYSDDDMLFYPGWLEKQVEIFTSFPDVSAVSGYPVRTAFRWGTQNTIRRMSACGKIETGRFIPEAWERDFAASVGRNPDWHCGPYTENDLDYRVIYQGKKAYCTAHHCQVIGKAGVLRQAQPTDNDAMGDEKPFDIALDKLGNRLCTTERLTRHMGNVLDDNLRKEIAWMRLS